MLLERSSLGCIQGVEHEKIYYFLTKEMEFMAEIIAEMEIQPKFLIVIGFRELHLNLLEFSRR